MIDAEEIDRLREIARAAGGVVRTAHPAKILDAVVGQWWNALVAALGDDAKRGGDLDQLLRDHLRRAHNVPANMLETASDEETHAWHILDHRLNVGVSHPYA